MCYAARDGDLHSVKAHTKAGVNVNEKERWVGCRRVNYEALIYSYFSRISFIVFLLVLSCLNNIIILIGWMYVYAYSTFNGEAFVDYIMKS